MKKYILSKNYSLREVAEEVILFGTNNGVINGQLSVVFNEAGAELCKALISESTIEDLTNVLIKKYSISSEVAKNDVLHFIEKCLSDQLIDIIE